MAGGTPPGPPGAAGVAPPMSGAPGAPTKPSMDRVKSAVRLLFDAIGDDPELLKSLNPAIEYLINVLKGESDKQRTSIARALKGDRGGPLDRTPKDGGPEEGTPLNLVTRLLTLAGRK